MLDDSPVDEVVPAGRGLLVHEWLGTPGGSERVFLRMTRLFPSADVLCLWNDEPEDFRGRYVRESVLARTPLRRKKSLALPFMPLAWRMRQQEAYDWALVSSHLFAHHVNIGNSSGGTDGRKIVYVHTPARYIWEPGLDVRGQKPWVRAASSVLKRRDRAMAQTADVLIANSAYVRERIGRVWGRDARVIHPPVEVARIQSVSDWRSRVSDDEQAVVEGVPKEFVLGASRFIPYKKLETVIRAGEVVGLPVVLAGWGPDEAKLRAAARGSTVPVTVISTPSDAMLFALYQLASVFVFPPVEDFGMMPVEAMACGTPVVVNSQGGARESVQYPVGGEILDDLSDDELRRATLAALELPRAAVAETAKAFDGAVFDLAITQVVRD